MCFSNVVNWHQAHCRQETFCVWLQGDRLAGVGRGGKSVGCDDNPGPDTPACFRNPSRWRTWAVMCLDRDQPCRCLLEKEADRTTAESKSITSKPDEPNKSALEHKRRKRASTAPASTSTMENPSTIRAEDSDTKTSPSFANEVETDDQADLKSTASWRATTKDGRWGNQEGPSQSGDDSLSQKRHKRHANKHIDLRAPQ